MYRGYTNFPSAPNSGAGLESQPWVCRELCAQSAGDCPGVPLLCPPPNCAGLGGVSCEKSSACNPIPGQICGSHPRNDCCRVPHLPSVYPANCCPIPVGCCGPEPAPNCVELARVVKKVQNYQPPCQPFEGCSMYRTDFKGCMGDRTASYKPGREVQFSSAPFDGCSIYRDDYRWKTAAFERIQKKNDYVPSMSPFEGASTYRHDFQGVFVSPPANFKPVGTADSSSSPMCGVSQYRYDFVPYCPLECDYARGVSVKPSNKGGDMPCSPFSGCSEYRMEFGPKYVEPSRYRPNERPSFSSAAFCGRSTYRNDYIPFYYRTNCQDQPMTYPYECAVPTSYC